ncbi:carbon-nitrogen hydrolase family protein [Micromonospora echinaurantiaca]|uniref:Carbon-nitrogen hydrolase family protein n=1 Tax=Micromonospora echinaurantiaca TaxID=47857 RepID=A0A1C5KB93_9ACTN|nr:carbon-nitrogen hydrolase family protein [Micromonospora echinaurantiaca]SCG80044.1 carbon-nitrogen hydrolase family protein [Micromonospora echinaurantiaca]
MKTTVTIGQIPTDWDIDANLAAIARVVGRAEPDDLVLLPEGALSGYAPDLSPLATLDRARLARAVGTVGELARQRRVHLFCGSLLPEDGVWWNVALHFTPAGERWTYRKINLAVNERPVLRAGAELPVRRVAQPWGDLLVGVQLCRELRYPEQWQQLARSGAAAFVYLTNAANPEATTGVWRSHLISRAAENQRYVFAVNLADPRQHCPSMVVSPRGEVLGELPPGETGILRTTIDLAEVSDWSLNQQRRDVIDLRYRPTPHHPAATAPRPSAAHRHPSETSTRP